MFQAENWSERQPVARCEENLFITEAYSDPSLQPVVVMKKLNDAQYVTTVNFEMKMKILNVLFC